MIPGAQTTMAFIYSRMRYADGELVLRFISQLLLTEWVENIYISEA